MAMTTSTAGDRVEAGSTQAPLRVCVIGLGGGGFHWEAQRIVQAVRRPLELVLVFAGPAGGLVYWDSKDAIKSRHIVRSPSLMGDGLPAKALGLLHNLRLAFAILSAERPAVVLAVGTAQAVPFAIAARALGIPLWFAESITRTRRPSRTATWMDRFRLGTRLYFYWDGLGAYLPGGIHGREETR